MNFDIDEDYIVYSVASDKYFDYDYEADAQTRAYLRKLKADAWDQAFEATCEAHDTYGGLNYTPTNPYRTVKDNK